MIHILASKKSITFIFLITAHFISVAQGKIIINGGKINMVKSAYVVTEDVSLINAGTLNVNNSTIKIAGVINSNSAFDVTSGTVEMIGSSSQTIPASAFSTNKILNLIISNNVTLAGQDSLTGILSFGAGNKAFATSGFLTLKSTSAYTAKVADITNDGTTSGNTISGNVKVERFINAVRAWRMLTAPINATSSQTINQAWQEGAANPTLTYAINQNPVPGFGVHIPGGATSLGFDKGINGNASLKIFKPATGTWAGIDATNRPITDSAGYMLFIRGDRSVDLNQGVNIIPTTTVLRSTGLLKINNQSFAVAPTGFTVIGNPYAAPLNLYEIAKSNSTNIQDNFYLWDPAITGTNGVGGYVNVSWNGSSYDITPSSGGSGLNEYVQSGYAFLAKTIDGATASTLIIKETDKYSGIGNSARPAGNKSPVLKTNMYSLNADGTISIVDGVLNSFAAIYSNSIDKYDALKITNFSESLSTQREGKLLVAERREPITSSDTIFLNMLQLKVKSYQFKFTAENFSNTSLSGFLEDSYFNTSTPINLQGATTFDFNVINVPGSWNPGRFRVVFKQAIILPVTFSTAKAFQQNENIKVEWKVENEINIKQYDIEKSGDGQQFVKAKTIMSKGNNSSSDYNWLDQTAFEGNNYYRIKSTGLNGEIKYSPVMKVFIGTHKQGIALTTNVITNNQIILQMTDMPKGMYAISITNSLGQVMYTKKIEREYGSSTENMELNKNFITGIYHLSIIKPDLTGLTMKFLMK